LAALSEGCNKPVDESYSQVIDEDAHHYNSAFDKKILGKAKEILPTLFKM
jgi:hypothetical protein